MLIQTIIIIIIIFSFYIALNTSRTSLSALQIYYYPVHWIQCLPAHNVCTIFTPWGACQPGVSWRSKTVLPTTTVASYLDMGFFYGVNMINAIDSKCFFLSFVCSSWWSYCEGNASQRERAPSVQLRPKGPSPYAVQTMQQWPGKSIPAWSESSVSLTRLWKCLMAPPEGGDYEGQGSGGLDDSDLEVFGRMWNDLPDLHHRHEPAHHTEVSCL